MEDVSAPTLDPGQADGAGRRPDASVADDSQGTVDPGAAPADVAQATDDSVDATVDAADWTTGEVAPDDIGDAAASPGDTADADGDAPHVTSDAPDAIDTAPGDTAEVRGPRCGDGAVEAPEICDGGVLDCAVLGEGSSGEAPCREDCSGYDETQCGRCGDGEVNGTEACEPEAMTTCGALDMVGGEVACAEDCQWDRSLCAPCTTDIVGCPGGPDCDQGACCDVAAGAFSPRHAACGDAVVAEEGRCAGQAIEARFARFGCSGEGADCSAATGDYAWSPWETVETCADGEFCSRGSGPACLPKVCTGGICCDQATWGYHLKGRACGAALPPQLECAGDRIRRREVAEGCPGDAAECSALEGDRHYGPWTTTEVCPPGHACWEVDGTPTCLPPPQCDAGPCCDVATRQFKPTGSLCEGEGDDEGRQLAGTQSRCLEDGNLEVRTGHLGCTGTKARCSAWRGHVVWSDWVVEPCRFTEVCIEPDPEVFVPDFAFAAYCASTSNLSHTQRDNGCWSVDPATRRWRPEPQGTPCSFNMTSRQMTRCNGNRTEVQTRRWGCVGAVPDCVADVPSGIWETREVCAPGVDCGSDRGCSYVENCVAGNYVFEGERCSAQATDEVFACSHTANAVVRRRAFASCSARGQCEGTTWNAGAETIEVCPEGTFCEACGIARRDRWGHAIGHDREDVRCVPGTEVFEPESACRSCETGLDAPRGRRCGQPTTHHEQRCVGDELQQREGQRYKICDGEGGCDLWDVDVAWGEWVSRGECAFDTECTEFPAHRTAACTRVEQTLPTGASCTESARCLTNYCDGVCKPAACARCAPDEPCSYSGSGSFLGCGGGDGGGEDPRCRAGAEGELTQTGMTVGGIALSTVTARWDIDTFIGEPTIFGTFRFTSVAGGQTLPVDTTLFIEVVSGDVTRYVEFAPTLPEDGSGDYGHNVTGSPSWDAVFCALAIGSTDCLGEADAKAFMADFCVTGYHLLSTR